MTQEEKQLLLKDLCARLPYEVKGLHRGEIQRLLIMDSFGSYQVNGYDAWFNLNSVDFKPYLRPIDSMTDDEINELDEVCDGIFNIYDTNIEVLSILEWEDSFENILKGNDWLNAHHFDYRGLIPMGLALEAKEGMYGKESV